MNRVAFGMTKESVSPMAADLQQLLATQTSTTKHTAPQSTSSVDLVGEQIERAFSRIVSTEKPFADFLAETQQDTLTEHHRTAVLGAMQEECRRLKLTPQTFSLAAHYFDMFLSAVKVRLSCLHLAGLACISVATKTMEIRKPETLVAALIGEAYSEGELQRMEKAVVAKVGKDMPVTPFEVVDAVLRATASAMPRGVRERTMQCHVIAVACAHHYELRSFLPSTTGLAIVSAVLDVECGPCADSVVALLCDALCVSASELAACRRVMQRCLATPTPHR